MLNVNDICGKRFGRLVVIAPSPHKYKDGTRYICQCDCGNTKEVRRTCLLKGFTKSCGCLRREYAVEHGTQMMTKHGWYKSRPYRIWHLMIDRCENPNTEQYRNYGGRGIGVCREWRESPQAFCEWAVSNGYKDNLTLDRIDVNGNYEPSNCRWITIENQQCNKRNNVLVTYNGKTQCVAEWSRELGLKQHRLYARIKAGWTNPSEILFGKRKGEAYA